jgi:hypothetical protein
VRRLVGKRGSTSSQQLQALLHRDILLLQDKLTPHKVGVMTRMMLPPIPAPIYASALPA